MNCADLEILLCDYVDGTLDAGQRAHVESHLSVCAGCRELASDASAAVDFIERAAEVEPPQELVTRIIFTTVPSRVRQRRGRVGGSGLAGGWSPFCSRGLPWAWR